MSVSCFTVRKRAGAAARASVTIAHTVIGHFSASGVPKADLDARYTWILGVFGLDDKRLFVQDL
ncbi:hypothetical protein FJ934_19645 [Mesorhizobium sp. B2-4-12]|uniref:hypothetical protein n=1 Tax=unclassified Mesorhizobium TaxID=325217 RepID=UPI00112EC2F6|nr:MULTISPECIES: hypothetical protein [unclassified Mesorhizobium]TPK93040.1 hypothetical protein FJ934_19645 [Mesorhizobium sp. B2-4-12]UCI34361.1 hypothetical protein FJW03_13460 [Mesorhizobium sp. B4-1-4]